MAADQRRYEGNGPHESRSGARQPAKGDRTVHDEPGDRGRAVPGGISAKEGDPADPYTGTFAAAIKRISWGAIFAGAVVALVIQLMLNLLGLSMGLGALDPATDQNPLGGLGTGAGIWMGITAIVALFAGGWTAGRLAGLPRRVDGILHGFVAWAVATFVTFYLVTSGVGTVLSGAFNVVEGGTRLISQGVGAVAPQAGQAIGGIGGEIDVEQVREEAMAILRDTDQEELQPENLAQRVEQATGATGDAAGDAAQSPAEAQQEIEGALDRLIASGEEVVSEVDRQAAVNVLMNRTDMSEQEARSTVEQYEQVFAQARTQVQQTAQQVGEQAPQIAEDVTDALSRAALWAFIAMFVGALAAAGGGAVGAPKDMPASPAIRRE